MRALVQRVERGAVDVAGERIAAIDRGLVVLLGVGREDTPEDAEYLAAKVAHLRIFAHGERLMDRSVLDVGGQALVVSQFTLYGDTRRGRRPSFATAAPPDQAEALYEHFVANLQALGVPVVTGQFQAHMLVTILNDGPVTLWLESPPAPST